MALNATPAAVSHNSALARFELSTGGALAVLEYRRDGQRLYALHTGVPLALRGQGIAARLTEALLAYCRAEGLRLIPRCSYTAAYLRRHPPGAAGPPIDD